MLSFVHNLRPYTTSAGAPAITVELFRGLASLANRLITLKCCSFHLVKRSCETQNKRKEKRKKKGKASTINITITPVMTVLNNEHARIDVL